MEKINILIIFIAFPLLQITHILTLLVKYHKEKISFRFTLLPLFSRDLKTKKEKFNDYMYKWKSKIWGLYWSFGLS